MKLYDRAALARALRPVPGFDRLDPALGPDDIEELAADGIAHLHLRIRGRGRLVRIPRFSQVATAPQAHLDYQAACFARAAPAGCTPRLIALLAPAEGLPMGGLVVEEILGHVPRLPTDLPALAESLARLHALALPPPSDRAPLVDQSLDPAGGALAHLERQAALLEHDGDNDVIDPRSRAILRTELEDLRALLAARAGLAQPAGLIGFDCHPGNFLIEPSGRAVFVDLERVQYGSPAGDLAHATLPSSTLWDRRIDSALTRRDLERFYRAYRRRLTPERAESLKPWLAVFRRLIFLRSTTWFLRFLTETRAGGWSAGSLDPAYLTAVERRIATLLEPPRLEFMRAEWRGREPFDPAICF